ncbi:MAG: hypothetical protein J6I60_02650 [Bacteroidaceae bacterium]|nr:hypothetical protein [Bacteroidaceae bacterium]
MKLSAKLRKGSEKPKKKTVFLPFNLPLPSALFSSDMLAGITFKKVLFYPLHSRARVYYVYGVSACAFPSRSGHAPTAAAGAGNK